MFKGVYEGKNAKHQSKRILILGESHYDKDGYNDFTTDSVVQNFYSNPGEKKYQFFHKIAKCFFENVKDIVAIGDVVKVKIIDIDIENKRISISMRALLEDEAEGEDAE